MDVKRGDIFYANLSDNFNSRIRENRPVLVLQNNIANKFAPTVIVAPLSSRLYNPKIPTQLKIEAKSIGLKTDSIVLLEQITTIDKHQLIEKVGNVGQSYMKMVMDALQIAIGNFEISNDKISYKNNTNNELVEIDKFEMEEKYKNFFIILENNTETLEDIRDGLKKARSIRSKIKEWLIVGIIGLIP